MHAEKLTLKGLRNQISLSFLVTLGLKFLRYNIKFTIPELASNTKNQVKCTKSNYVRHQHYIWIFNQKRKEKNGRGGERERRERKGGGKREKSSLICLERKKKRKFHFSFKSFQFLYEEILLLIKLRNLISSLQTLSFFFAIQTRRSTFHQILPFFSSPHSLQLYKNFQFYLQQFQFKGSRCFWQRL